MRDSRVFRFAKYFIIVAAAGFIGIFLGKMLMSYETRYMFNREYCGTYRGINIYKCGEQDKDNFLGHIGKLESAPKAITDTCTDLYFLEDHIMAGGMEVLGLTQGSTVYITTTSYYPDVLIHELFHTYDAANGNPSASAEFNYIYGAEKEYIGNFAPENAAIAAEYFAAAGAEYILNPELLERFAPKTYEYMENLLSEEQ